MTAGLRELSRNFMLHKREAVNPFLRSTNERLSRAPLEVKLVALARGVPGYIPIPCLQKFQPLRFFFCARARSVASKSCNIASAVHIFNEYLYDNSL